MIVKDAILSIENSRATAITFNTDSACRKIFKYIVIADSIGGGVW